MKAGLIVMLAAFAALRIVAVAGLEPVAYPDSPSYLRLDFLGGERRLWTVPLLYTALPGEVARVAAQVGIGIVCWSSLAFAVARVCRHGAAALGGAVAVLLLGLAVQVTQWDLTLLSESVTLSLTALAAALGLLVADRRGGRAVVYALGAAVVLWGFTRHVNAGVLVAGAPVVAGVALWRLPRRPAIVLVAALALVTAWAVSASLQSGLGTTNGQRLLVERLLQDPDAARHFSEHGLEMTPRLRQAVRLYEVQPDAHFDKSIFDEPRLARWYQREWRSAYASYLLENAPQAVLDPLRKAADELAAGRVYSAPTAVLPGPVQDTVWNRRDGLAMLVAAAGALLLWLASLRPGRLRRVEIVPWILAGVGVTQLELAWNYYGGPEIPRLFTPGGVSIMLGLLVLAALGADRLLTEEGNQTAQG